jgi:hypothetical protein
VTTFLAPYRDGESDTDGSRPHAAARSGRLQTREQARAFDGCDAQRRRAGLVASPHQVSRKEFLNHLAAWQEPDLFTTEIRAAFRSLR